MNADDPKLTAYALDELDSAEREDIAKMLRDDPAAAAAMEAARAFAAQLRVRLKAESAGALHPGQRAEVIGRIGSVSRKKVITLSHRAAGLAALAAGVLIGAGVALIFPALHSMKGTPQKPGSASAEAGAPGPRDGSDVRVSLAIERAPASAEPLVFQDFPAPADATTAARYSGMAFAPRAWPSHFSGFGAAQISLGNFQPSLPRNLDGTLRAPVLAVSLNDFSQNDDAMPAASDAAPQIPARRAGREEPVKQKIGAAPPRGPVRAWSGGRMDSPPDPAGEVSPQGSRP